MELGNVQQKLADIEVWMPYPNKNSSIPFSRVSSLMRAQRKTHEGMHDTANPPITQKVRPSIFYAY